MLLGDDMDIFAIRESFCVLGSARCILGMVKSGMMWHLQAVYFTSYPVRLDNNFIWEIDFVILIEKINRIYKI